MAEPNINALRAFVAVAELLHFTRAAESLHMTTPALSQQIHRLETLLGTPLFVRSSRRVVLTAAGSELLPLARESIDALDHIQQWSKQRQIAVLRVGFVHVGAPEQLAEVFAAVPDRLNGAHLDFVHLDRDGIAAALRNGEVDVAFCWGPQWLDGVASYTLTTAPRAVLMRTDAAEGLLDPDMKAVSMGQLRDASFLVPAAADERYASWALVDPRPSGSRPRRGPSVRNLEEAFAMVATGLGVYLVPEPVAHAIQHPGVAWATVTDIPHAPFSVCISERTASPLSRRFLELLRNLFGLPAA